MKRRDVSIRDYELGDAETCRRIAGSAVDWDHVVDESATRVIVAERDDEIVGYAYLQVWSWNQVAWIGDLLVHHDHRGQGAGTALLERLLDLARSAGCTTAMDHPPPDHPALSFYLRHGFRLCGYNDSWLPEPGRRTVVFVACDLDVR